MMSAIANGGTVYRPHVVRMIERVKPDGTTERLQVAPEVLHRVKLPEHSLEAVQTGMWKVVNEEGGTGGNARVAGLDICGKTGTVQVVAGRGNTTFKTRDHAWFAAYATKEAPQMVVVVFVEHAGTHGGVVSAPLAKLMFESRFKKELENARLDLKNPETLQEIREGKAPVPGQEPKAPPVAPGSGVGH